jgi:hypothetical protein
LQKSNWVNTQVNYQRIIADAADEDGLSALIRSIRRIRWE